MSPHPWTWPPLSGSTHPWTWSSPSGFPHSLYPQIFLIISNDCCTSNYHRLRKEKKMEEGKGKKHQKNLFFKGPSWKPFRLCPYTFHHLDLDCLTTPGYNARWKVSFYSLETFSQNTITLLLMRRGTMNAG